MGDRLYTFWALDDSLPRLVRRTNLRASGLVSVGEKRQCGSSVYQESIVRFYLHMYRTLGAKFRQKRSALIRSTLSLFVYKDFNAFNEKKTRIFFFSMSFA